MSNIYKNVIELIGKTPLVEVENVEQLANAIIDILKDRKKFDREYIAKYVKDNHSQDVLTQELIDVYEQALNL